MAEERRALRGRGRATGTRGARHRELPALTAAAVETHALAKRFGRRAALTGLDLRLLSGEAFGLLGPNGAGKTTAVKLLLGLVRPTSGSATVLGAPLGDREARRRIGYVPELFRYHEWLTAAEVLGLHARLIDMPRAMRSGAVAAGLDRVGLAARAGDRVATFSKGMQQRLGIAVALLGAPDLIVLDEPTSALDPVGRHDVRAIVEEERARGATVVLNSHLLTEIERVCDRVAILDRGTIVAGGRIDDLLGVATTLRLRLEGVTPDARGALARRGTLTIDGPWYALAGVAEADVPAIVAELVANGASIHAVEPARATLEDRFLELLRPADDARDRDAHAA